MFKKYRSYLVEADSLERILNNGFRGNKSGRQKRLEDLKQRLIPRTLAAVIKTAKE